MSDTNKRARSGSLIDECRACLMKIKDDSRSVDIFRAWDPSWSGMGASIAQDLTKISNIQISVSDPHSKIICKRCCIRLQDALEFTLRVQKNDQILRKRIKESSNENPLWPKPIQVDKNLSTSTLYGMVEVKQEVLSDDEYETNESYSDPSEPHLDIKIEPEEITPMAGNDEPAVKKAKTTNGPNELLVECNYGDVKEEPMSEDECEPVSDMPKDCMLCLKTFNTVKGLKAHVIAVHSYKTVTSPKVERTNVCTTCNRSFATRTDLFVHETCHSQFACYVCDQKFDTFQLLTVHRSSCMRNCEIPRLKTLKDVRRPPVYYIIDKKNPSLEKKDQATDKDSIKIDSQVTATKDPSPCSVETKTVPEPLDPGKYRIIEDFTEKSLESSQTDTLSTVNKKSAAMKLPSEGKVSESIDQSNKTMEVESEKTLSIKETNSSQKISDVIIITTENTQKSDETDSVAIEHSESKKVDDIEQVDQSVTSHNNELSLKPELSNNNTKVDRLKVSDEIQKNNSEVSIVEKESESEVSLQKKVNELEIDTKLTEASNKMDVDTSEELHEKMPADDMPKVCNEIKENVKTTFEDSQELQHNGNDKKNNDIFKLRNEVNEIVESFETSSNEDSQKLQDNENDKKNDDLSKLRNEINEIVQSFETSSNEDSQVVKEDEDGDNNIDKNVKSFKTSPNKNSQELQNNESNKNDNLLEEHNNTKETSLNEDSEILLDDEVCNKTKEVKPTFDTSANLDFQELKGNQTEDCQSQSLETCANKDDNTSELTDTNKMPSKDLPLIPELNMKSVDYQCNLTKESMEIELEVHSMDCEGDAMEIDNIKNVIKVNSENDKGT